MTDNVYVKALDSKIAQSANASESNKKKLAKLRAMLANKQLAQLLRDSSVTHERFTRAMYASEKVVKFASHSVESFVDFAKVNVNAFAAFKTAMQFHDAMQNDATLTLTKRDIECAISRAEKARDEKADALIYRASHVLSADTLNAQSQQCVDMLKTLNIISERASRVYSVNENALAKALREKFAI